MKAKQIEETVTAIPIATETFGGATLSCDVRDHRTVSTHYFGSCLLRNYLTYFLLAA